MQSGRHPCRMRSIIQQRNKVGNKPETGWGITLKLDIRAPQIHSVISSDGVGAIPKLLSIQVFLYSIITAPVYFIAALLS